MQTRTRCAFFSPRTAWLAVGLLLCLAWPCAVRAAGPATVAEAEAQIVVLKAKLEKAVNARAVLIDAAAANPNDAVQQERLRMSQLYIDSLLRDTAAVETALAEFRRTGQERQTAAARQQAVAQAVGQAQARLAAVKAELEQATRERAAALDEAMRDGNSAASRARLEASQEKVDGLVAQAAKAEKDVARAGRAEKTARDRAEATAREAKQKATAEKARLEAEKEARSSEIRSAGEGRE